MVFSSYIFLFVFLPVFLVLYWIAPRIAQNSVALLASAAFYAWGEPIILPILLASASVDYWLSLFFAPSRGLSPGWRRALVSLGLATNLGLLVYFKYSNFFFEEVNALFEATGISPVPWLEIALPIGISFFTFQKISYLVDVYRGEVDRAPNFRTYALFVCLFPQLIAGPIIRYRQIASQLIRRSLSVDDVLAGASRFSIGLGKKVLIADPLGAVMDNTMALPGVDLSIGYAWLGTVCYAFQIYFDFSGYSDMAIGLGRMLGFRFPENFNHPYVSQNFTEFWRRWHMSLSAWMREYLYIPLGGNRVSPSRMYVNLWAVFLLSGLWHGASWSFVVWGAFHGLFLVLDKLWWLRRSAGLPRVFNVALTFFLVCIGWVFFRAPDLGTAIAYLGRMFDVTSIAEGPAVYRAAIINNRAIAMLVVAMVLSFSPRPRLRRLSAEDWSPQFRVTATGLASIVLLVLSACAIVARGHTPFLYFRF